MILLHRKNTYTFLLLILFLFLGQNTTLGQNIDLREGSGSFPISLHGAIDKPITVCYYYPKNFNQNTRVLMVLPGAGRNADDYRDAWIESAEKHNILVLSLFYPEKQHPYENYHLGGIVKDLDMRKGVSFKKETNQVHVDENRMTFTLNKHPNTWIFQDFDRVFSLVKEATGITQNKYDMFGHSAGGQILHRMVLLHPFSKVNRIIAANSGSYTLPDTSAKFPFGIKNISHTTKMLAGAFQKKLTILLGEKDNANETRGRILRSKTADQQGTHRLARGKYFFNFCKKIAQDQEIPFQWHIKIVPNARHNQKHMAKAAATYLYEATATAP